MHNKASCFFTKKDLDAQLGDFLLQQAAGNAILWFSVLVVGDVGRLQEFVHHASFRDGKGEEAVFSQSRIFDELVVDDGKCMDGEILAQWALVDSAIGENKKVFSGYPGTGKLFIFFQKG